MVVDTSSLISCFPSMFIGNFLNDFEMAPVAHILLVSILSLKNSMRSINLLILFGIRRNSLRSGRNRSFYLPIRRVIKQIVVIIGAFHFCQLRTRFIQHPAVKVHSICRGNYWRSSVWISMQQINYWSYVLHLSNT